MTEPSITARLDGTEFVEWFRTWSIHEPPIEYFNGETKITVQYEPVSDRIALKFELVSSYPTGEQLGKADWIWEPDLMCHVPCCSIVVNGSQSMFSRCGNGPLTGDAIKTGDCGEHGDK